MFPRLTERRARPGILLSNRAHKITRPISAPAFSSRFHLLARPSAVMLRAEKLNEKTDKLNSQEGELVVTSTLLFKASDAAGDLGCKCDNDWDDDGVDKMMMRRMESKLLLLYFIGY